MSKEIRVAVIGLDTSHSVAFTKIMQSPQQPAEQKISGMRVVSCLRFATPFQNEEGLDARQKDMEAMGVKVTRCFDEAVADCDAVMIEINDPAPHLEYFRRCVALGKPIFLDKPLADNIGNGKQIVAAAAEADVPFFSTSPLRYDRDFVDAKSRMKNPAATTVWGPLGLAPSGSSVVWYGVHAFEMLQGAMGCGAAGVLTVKDMKGVVAHVDYRDGRRGVVELTSLAYRYGGVLRDHENPEEFFRVTGGATFYFELMKQVAEFFRTGKAPLTYADMLEGMGMLDAAERSLQSGRRETVYC